MSGQRDLTLGDGNLVYGNTAPGIYATGNVLVAGNTVHDQTGNGNYGITVYRRHRRGERRLRQQPGIDGIYAGPITANRTYDDGTGIAAYGNGRRDRATTSPTATPPGSRSPASGD